MECPLLCSAEGRFFHSLPSLLGRRGCEIGGNLEFVMNHLPHCDEESIVQSDPHSLVASLSHHRSQNWLPLRPRSV